MAKALYFRNAKTGKRYRVIRKFKDAEGKEQVELQGTHAVFREPYDKDRFKRLGYTLEVEEADESE